MKIASNLGLSNWMYKNAKWMNLPIEIFPTINYLAFFRFIPKVQKIACSIKELVFFWAMLIIQIILIEERL